VPHLVHLNNMIVFHLDFSKGGENDSFWSIEIYPPSASTADPLVSGDHKLVLEGPLPPGCEELGRVEAYGGKTIIYPKDEGAIQLLVEHSLKAGVRVAIQPVTLEDAFIYLVSEAGA